MSNQIQVADVAEFKRLLDVLLDELIDAEDHFRLNKQLRAAISEYQAALNEAGVFWNMTFSAHMDAALMRLCRAYDLYGGGKPTLNLRSFLETVKANLHFFDERNFRERLKDNPYLESLADDHHKPDGSRLEMDLEFVTSGPPVKKLTIWRNNYVAHRSITSALGPNDFTTKYPLTFDEIGELIEKGLSIMNHYSSQFNASHYIGFQSTDYKNVLNAIKRDFERRQAEIEHEIKRYTAGE
jgi:hypothetical protein